ncbi:MAG: hypothetical protein H7Y28_16555 [Rhodoferax sp.]|nr:hypothetical protein [Rhodoferax sp.]
MATLAMWSCQVHAELVFRSLQQTNGQASWSNIKKYSNAADIAYLPSSAGRGSLPTDEVRVYLTGEITRQDLDGAAVMEGLIQRGRQRLNNNTLWLSSGGGDIDVGMDLGRLIRKLGMYTLVDKNDRCMSACVFAFMGGERRSVAGQLGIHRPYFPFTQDLPDRAERFRHLKKTLKDFVEELDFPSSLYEAVMLVPPESFEMISSADLKRFYLEGISPSSEDRVDAAGARRLGISMFDYLKRKARTPACSPLDIVYGRCASNTPEAGLKSGANSAAGIVATVQQP